MITSVNSELAMLEARMRELVGLLDGAQANVAVLERAWSACAAHGPAIEQAARQAASAAGEERAALRAQLERLVELNAAAKQAVLREQAALARSLAHARATRSSLDHLQEAPLVGDSCNVSG